MAQHVLIVGAGVIGLSSAYHCLREGMRVTVLDRHPEQRTGCSFGNAGMIVPSHFIPLAAPGMVALGLKWMWNPESPFYIKPRLRLDLWSWCYRFWRSATTAHVERSGPLLRDLHLASRACYEEWAESSGNAFGLEKRGLLMLCKTPHALEEEAKTAESARRLGVPAEVLDARQTADRDPNVRMDVAGAVYYPKDCHLSPDRLMAWLLDEVKKMGGDMVWRTEVTGWRRQGRRLEAVQTSEGDHEADEFVICGGSWSANLVKDLDLRLPLQAGKGYSLTLEEPRRLPKICAILVEARVAVTPMGKALRFGGTMEIAGLDETINPKRVRGIIRSIPQYYPDFKEEDFANLEPWCGLRPCSPDGLPYLGRTLAWDNLIIASGHAMMGISLGPITGKIVAEIAGNQKLSSDVSLLAPDRFGI
jgi:D-amino-acid dehydrogenase